MQKMNVQITDLQEKGTCEYTGKEGEVIVCSLDEQMPDVVLSTQEFFRQLRFRRLQSAKKARGSASASSPQSKAEGSGK